MNYLLDKKNKRNKNLKIIGAVLVFIILFYFRAGVFSGLGYVSTAVFRPVLSSGNGAGRKLTSFASYFSFKSSLSKENADLKSERDADSADRANYASVVAENAGLKEILGRKNEQVKMTLGAILAKPNQSPYDTLLIDIGVDKGIKMGDRVFAFGNLPIGRIAEAYPKSSKVILFSNSGEATEVVLSPQAGQAGNIFTEVAGRGGGNFEMIVPRDLVLWKGDQAVLPGITPYVIGVVETVISDPRDSSQKALLVSPVNIQQLKFVEVAN
ncbi:MAG TPA: rod shape-determining protein MreC [Candidatus Paceibacterota bacterium]|jgi:cell shape-determining protein MreC|nr:rod shape-determining protein MreC [Candidatus Paceibacterota bacterium]